MNEQLLINKTWEVVNNYLTESQEKTKKDLKLLHMELTNLKTRGLLHNDVLVDAVGVLSIYFKEGKTQKKLVKQLRESLSKIKKN